MIETNPQGPGFFLFFQDEIYHGSKQKKKRGCREEICEEDDIVMEIITLFLKSK